MQTKLTLRLDEAVIRDAKLLAKSKGQSVSQIVANYFKTLKEKPREERDDLTPIVKSLKGAWRGQDLGLNEYQQYLEKKYQ
jgi:hypothetical protein